MPVKIGDQHHPDDIVISGISGKFPDSDNVEEFKTNLLNGKNMTSAVSRWDASEVLRTIGALKNIDRFDDEFFHMDHHKAEDLPHSTRLLLERIFEAILDAGYNPQQIRKKNIAVICAQPENFSEEVKVSDDDEDSTSRAKFYSKPAGIISHWFDLKGPFFTMDSACSTALMAIDNGSRMIQNGDCEGVLICGLNICTLPADFYYFMGIHSVTGVCSPFDSEGDGFVRAEAAIGIFLQKRKDARRIYANLLHAKSNCDGFNTEGVTFPSAKMQKQLYMDFYKELNINPSHISFLETHGTGTKVGDVIEGNSIEEFFCANRETPLMIGSIKSNIGHAEEAAGACSLVKMIISFEEGMIPPNINFNNPNPKIKGLVDGKFKVITKPTPVDGEYYAISSFGVGGANTHIVISPNNKVKKMQNELIDGSLSRLVTFSGRTEEGFHCILKDLKKNHTDYEYIRLLHEIFSENIDEHHYRGYVILNRNEKHLSSKKLLLDKKHSLWFVFAGMGSQWPAMGVSLMKIPIFAESICRSHKILESKGVNLLKIITSNDPQIITNILNTYVGIVAIQIALLDVLNALEVKPDGIIGHAVGEIACAYADKCLTAEQTILIAYYYGLVSLEAEFIHSTMAVIGQGYNDIKNQIPAEIDIISHDGPSCCTLSGPTDVMQGFIEELNKKNISVREIHSSHISYDSRYITSAASKLTSYFKKIIAEPKLRSKKWLCTSAPEHLWSTEELKYCSAQYFTNNFLSPVYFEETYAHIPNNAVVIEIAPYGYLNDIPKCLPRSLENIPLTTKSRENGVDFFLNALGRIYEAGCTLKLSNLYPPVEFPVSKSTPMISPLIKWKHDKRWQVGRFSLLKNDLSTVQDIIINPRSTAYEFITGHVIDERNLYPGLGYLELVWNTIANMQKKNYNSFPIVFENVRFERATNITKKITLIAFRVTIHRVTNKFEITERGALVVSGNVRIPKNITQELFEMNPFEDEISNSEILPLNTKDFYKELRLKGYHYKGMFKKVVYANANGTYGRVPWENNFTTFMDTMAQVTAMYADCRQLLVPTFIRKLTIDVDKHNKILETLDKEKPEFPVNFYPSHGLLNSGGVQIIGLGTAEIARQPDKVDPVLEKHIFVPYICDEVMDLNVAIRLCVHIALENLPEIKVKTLELLNREYNEEAVIISTIVAKTLADLPLIQASVKVLTDSPVDSENEFPQGLEVCNEELPDNKSCLLIVLSDIRNKTELFEKIYKALKENGFIITRESRQEKNSLRDLGFDVCFSRAINSDEEILLLRKINEGKLSTKIVRIRNDSFSWVPEVKNILTNIKPEENEELVVYAEKEPMSGILGLSNCLKNEKKGAVSRCFFIAEESAPEFSLDSLLYKSQLDKRLFQNVFKNGQWGSYRHLPLESVQDVDAVRAFCALEKRADLSSFKWFEDPLHSTITFKNSKDTFLVHVYFSSLNFRDIMLAVGRISPANYHSLYSRLHESYLGTEYSGRDENGRRVMGIVPIKGIATMVEGDSNSTWVIPDHLSMEEAATIPIIYITVVYALFFRVKLKPGISILIHAGSGGIGQAAINICLHYGCKIFTTVGTPEKVEFIKNTFPQIPECHIGNTRDTTFEKVIMEQTNGRGVDIVLNSLAEEKLKTSLRCVARGGHFVEIGKYDMARNNNIGMDQFVKNITFHSIQLDVAMWKLSDVFEKLRGKVQDMINEGIIKPIQRTIFQADQVEAAFRYIAAGKHMGKVLIKIRDEEVDLESKPVILHMKAKPRVLCEANKSYVIVGGLGGFGLELTDWLIIRGARNIVLSSRTGVKNGYQSYRIKLWRSYGANIVISTDDITQEEGVKQLLLTGDKLGPVSGIFNVAMVLKDDPLSKQTEEMFKAVADPKAVATAHLDKVSREVCPDLKHFVVFSSVSCGRGNINQTNYGFSNSVMERICESRHADNLPALAIQWGAIGEVGVVADFAENNLSIVIGGTLQQNVKSCLNTLNLFMKQSNPIVASMIVAEKRHANSDIINTIANILGIKDLKTISLTWTFPELGMDSIVGVEIKQVLDAEFNTFFSPEDLRTMTFAKLYKMKEEKAKSLKSGEDPKSQFKQFAMDIELVKEPFLHIPLDNGELKKPQNCGNSTLFIFPGGEGLASLMEPLVKNLPFQAMCFQYYNDEFPVDSISEGGDYFIKFITDTLTSDQEFFIVGYSFGGYYALEVINILEKMGRKGYLYLIDTSPSYARILLDNFAKKYRNKTEALQNYICIETLKSIFPDIAADDYLPYIEKANDWEAKKKLFLSMTARYDFNEDLMNKILEKGYFYYKILPDYEPKYKALETPCTLIRSSEVQKNLDEYYGLTRYFKNPVQVHKIEETHHNLLKHPKTAEIILDCPLYKNNTQ